MEPFRLQPECIRCLLRKYVDACPAGTPKETQTAYLQTVLSIISSAPSYMSAPVLTSQIDEACRNLLEKPMDYTEIKFYFNQLMMEKETEVYRKICQAEDPLRAAVQYAMTGNYIDFGALDHVDEETLNEFLKNAETIQLDEKQFSLFSEDIRRMKRMVFLTDNCGEVVMDKLLLKTIQKFNPKAECTVIVRGKNVLNDATMQDAEQIGLREACNVIGNGTSIAGTWLPSISSQARQQLESADVIISKGQGNFETLHGCGLNIYYLFLCKCDLFARRFHVPKFTGILVNDRFLPSVSE